MRLEVFKIMSTKKGGSKMGKSEKERISGLVVLIDETTFEDAYNHKPVRTVILVTEQEAGDSTTIRLPRIRLSTNLVQAGPETVSEYVREEIAKRIGITITDPLTLEEELVESKRTLLIFSGIVSFTDTPNSIYLAVTAKSLAELRLLRENNMISKLHYDIAKRMLLA